jgi:hypothetical protein
MKIAFSVERLRSHETAHGVGGWIASARVVVDPHRCNCNPSLPGALLELDEESTANAKTSS